MAFSTSKVTPINSLKALVTVYKVPAVAPKAKTRASADCKDFWNSLAFLEIVYFFFFYLLFFEKWIHNKLKNQIALASKVAARF